MSEIGNNHKSAYQHLVQYALNQGNTVSVWDGEEWQVTRSKDFAEIIEAIESVDDAAIEIRDTKQNICLACASVMQGLENEENVYDYSDNLYMCIWETAYKEIKQ